MSVVIVSGSSGLIGSEAASHFAGRGHHVAGIDNDMRRQFFGASASTAQVRQAVEASLKGAYTHADIDIRDADSLDRLFAGYGREISLVVHTAAQPSHDWAVKDPQTDFAVNATGTLNMLEATRRHAPDAVFIFTSTNKVYGDRPNSLPLVELETRWEIAPGHDYEKGIPESFSIDGSLHSLFGASKLSADVLVQEYGRYFGMKTACFRGGCLTGPNHSGAMLHGFLSYLMKCAIDGTPYTVFGYKAKQVRDNLHSADLIAAFEQFYSNPKSGAVYNIGGGRYSNCSMLEAIATCEKLTGRAMNWQYKDENRIGDHIWWISDLSAFQADYPTWKPAYDVDAILREIHDANQEKWQRQAAHA